MLGKGLGLRFRKQQAQEIDTSKLAFLWIGGEELSSVLDEKALVVTGKDFSSSYIPASSSATFSIPDDPTLIAADTDNFWHTGSTRLQKTTAQLVALNNERTFIYYDDIAPYHIRAVGILLPGAVLSTSDEDAFSAFFHLDMFYFGYQNDFGYIKENRTAPQNIIIAALERDTTLVQVSSTGALVAQGSGVWGATIAPGTSLLSKYKTERIRQSGFIERINLSEILSIAGVGSFKIYFWRKDATPYDKIATLDLLPLVSAGFKTVYPDPPIQVQEGDFIGYHLERSGASNVNMLACTPQSGGSWTVANESPSDQNYPWESKTNSDYLTRTHAFMQAPLLVGFGDSIIESYPQHTSFVDTGFSQVDIPASWLAKLLALDPRCIYQNLGIGGNTTTQMLARMDSQVLPAKARCIIGNGGVNDIAGGSISKATFLSNVAAMWDKAVAADSYVIWWKIMPWTNGTNLQMQTRDEWNAALVELAKAYPTVMLIDWDQILGQTRVGGDPGNLWDIKPEYNHDGVHFNQAGYQLIAQTMATILQTEWWIKANPPFCDQFKAVYDSWQTKPSDSVSYYLNRMVNNLVNKGTWGKIECFEPYAVHTNAGNEAIKDWINLNRPVSLSNPAPVFTPFQGFKGVVASNTHIKTGFYPFRATRFQKDNHSWGLYNRFARAGSSTKGHGVMSTSVHMVLIPRSGAGNFLVFDHSATQSTQALPAENASAQGFFIVRRNTSTHCDLIRNKVEIGPDKAANSANMEDYEFYVLAYNNKGTIQYPTDDEIALFFAGEYLTDSDFANITDEFEAYMKSNGKGVIP